MVPEKVWTIAELDKEEEKTLNNLNMDSASNENWWDQVDMTKLILACNKISAISPQISNLCSLTILDLPDSIGELQRMSKLNLSHNRFKEIPEGIFMMKELRVLQLNNNKLEVVDARISEVNMLNNFDLANNEIKSLPGSFGFLTKISNLNLSNNQLETLPSEISSMAGLATLELTNNKLSGIPDSMQELSHLEILYLRHNKLTSIPVLTHCINLKELHLGNNRIIQEEENNRYWQTAPPQGCLQEIQKWIQRGNSSETQKQGCSSTITGCSCQINGSLYVHVKKMK